MIEVGSWKELMDLVSKAKVVLLDVWAEWCPPCKLMSPHFEAAAKAAKEEGLDVVFAKLKIDSDEAYEVAEKLEVYAIPCLILFVDGKEVDRHVGFMPTGNILAWLKEQLGL